MKTAAIVCWVRRWQRSQPVAELRGLLDGLDVVVDRVHEVGITGAGAGAVPPQLLELETLAVFTAHVHQQAVVRYTEYPAGLRRRHLLVPNLLERLGELGVRPRSGRSTSRRTVLTFRPVHRQTPSGRIAPSARCVAVTSILLLLFVRKR